jgi:hypothetical protein
VETTWIQIGDVLVRAPVTAGTNLAVSLQCLVYALGLRESLSRRSRLWAGFFAAMSLATLAGVFKHGFRHEMPEIVFVAVLTISNLAGAGAVYFAQRAAFSEIPGRRLRRGVTLATRAQLAVFGLANVALGPRLSLLIANTAVGLPPVMAAEARRRGSVSGGGGVWIAGGLAVSALTGVVYLTRVSLGPWFNHNDIAHVCMALSFLVIHRGVRIADGPTGAALLVTPRRR